MSALSQNFQEFDVIPQQTLAESSLTSSYQIVGQIFGAGVVQLLIVSTYDHTVQMSLDGVHDWIPMPATSTLIIDFKSNRGGISGAWGLYVKTLDSPTTGSIYVSGFKIRQI